MPSGPRWRRWGAGTTLLVDTYDVREAVRLGIDVAGTELGAVRIDSGDQGALAHEVRAELDALGATNTRILVTSDLDEFSIAALAAAPVDAYGVGTQLVVGSGHPTCGFVYKLVARESDDGEMVAVAKKSTDKISIGGRKWAMRRLSARRRRRGRGDRDRQAAGERRRRPRAPRARWSATARWSAASRWTTRETVTPARATSSPTPPSRCRRASP